MTQRADVIKTLPISNWEWPRIVVFIPLPIALPFVSDVLPNFIAIAQQGAPFIWVPHGRTDYVRNQAADKLLESSYTHILMLDSDHKHPPNIVQRLARHVVEDPSRQIVGGLNFRRGEPYDPLINVRQEDGSYIIPEEWDAGLIEVDIIGTGAVLISRSVFEEIGKPFFWYDYSHVDIDSYPSEDIAFCKKARGEGFRIWCDTTVVSPHMKPGWVAEQTFRSYLAMQEAQLEKSQ
jgi:hypothetical protein